MKKIIDLIDLVVFLLIFYPVGIILGYASIFLKATRRIKIIHSERFPRKESFLMVANHLSLADPFITLCLFFPDALFHPFKLTPYSTPDLKNFYSPWYFFWVRPFSIPVNRDARGREKARPLLQMKRFLEEGKRIILFPEGGRTYKGVGFRYSRTGRRIRKLTRGVGWLAVKTGVPVVPIWLEGTDKVLPNTKFPFPKLWKRIVVKIGKPLRFDGKHSKEKATEKIEEVLLYLADEKG